MDLYDDVHKVCFRLQIELECGKFVCVWMYGCMFSALSSKFGHINVKYECTGTYIHKQAKDINNTKIPVEKTP